MATRTRYLPTLVVVAAALGGGCDDSETDDRSAPSTTMAPEANDRAAAVNLVIEDLPPGFVAAADDDERAGGVLAQCVSGFTADTVAEADAPVFQAPAGEGRIFVTSTTVILGSEERASELLDALQEPAAMTCLRDAIASGLVDTGQGGAIESTSLTPAGDVPDYGEQRAEFAGTVTFTAPGVEEPVELTYSLVLVRTDGIVTLLLYGGLLEPFPSSTVVELTEVVAGRQQTA